MMNSILQSSLLTHDFVKYRKNVSETDRKRFSTNVRTKGINEIPVVVDSIDSELSLILASKTNKRYERNGKEFHLHAELTIEDFIYEIQSSFFKEQNTIILKLGLENGKILNKTDILGDLYNKFRNKDDNILYLLLTKETTVYGYIMSILRYIFGDNFMKI